MIILPNVLVTGTPGVGKSKLCKKLVVNLKNRYKYHNISQVAKDNGCLEGDDTEYDCPIIDEDKLLDFLEPIMSQGGNIVEYHGCDFFPERWFRLVFVLQCDNTILYDRLKKRNYKEKKIKENIECEIFHTILDDAQDSYDKSIVHVLKNENSADLNAALERICILIKDEEEKSSSEDEEDSGSEG